MAMLRLASSTVVPLALRAIASPRILSGSIANAFSGPQDSIVKRKSPFISHHFSTDAKKLLDHKLAKILKSEIKSKELSLKKSMPPPAHFPFTIQDDPHATHITLTRELDGEKIDVLVSIPWALTNPIYTEDDEEERDFSDTNISDDDKNNNGSGGGADDSSSTDSSDEEKDKSSADPAPSLDLVVKISKENGKILDFHVSASADEIKIRAMSAMEPAAEPDDPLQCYGPYYFEGMDSDLQFALTEFLVIRGIKKTYVGFLYEYMVRKSKRDPMLVLKKLRKFIKE